MYEVPGFIHSTLIIMSSNKTNDVVAPLMLSNHTLACWFESLSNLSFPSSFNLINRPLEFRLFIGSSRAWAPTVRDIRNGRPHLQVGIACTPLQ